MPSTHVWSTLDGLCKKLTTQTGQQWVCDTYTMGDQRGVVLFPANHPMTDGFFFISRRHRLVELNRNGIPDIGLSIEEFAALLEYAESP